MSYTEYDFPHTHFYETDLRELIAKCGSYDEVINKLNQWIEENDPKIDEILSFMKQLENGYIPPGLKESIYNWATDNLIPIIAKVLRNVYFGLTNDGYFCAFIPQSWNWVTFDTITDFSDPLYGHLVLQYD